MQPFGVAFALDLAHGACVAVRLPPRDAPIDAALVVGLADEERAFAVTLAPARRASWIGGRVALRAAASRVGVSLGAVLATPRGAPALPPSLAGSISHKDTIAVALAARADGAARGVDVEVDVPRRFDVSGKVLRDEELAALSGLDAASRDAEVLLRFSAKESIYKALDPFVGRYVAFKEARVTPRADGGADAALLLAQPGGDFDVDVRWLRREGVVVTTARIARR